MANQTLLAHTFVELADTLVDTYDVIDFLHLLTDRCVELLDANEGGVMLADPAGGLRVLASTSDRMRAMELFEVQNQDGPCLDAWKTIMPIAEGDLAGARLARWTHFAPMAVDAGFGSVYALPMRLRDNCIGALNLFAEAPRALSDEDLLLAQALADVASIGILQERLTREQTVVREQLQTALDSRVVIEQQAGIDVDAAFALLRSHTRSNNRRMTDVATDIVQGRLAADQLVIGPALSRPRRT
jgi:GAF domain-containing protein